MKFDFTKIKLTREECIEKLQGYQDKVLVDTITQYLNGYDRFKTVLSLDEWVEFQNFVAEYGDLIKTLANDICNIGDSENLVEETRKFLYVTKMYDALQSYAYWSDAYDKVQRKEDNG